MKLWQIFSLLVFLVFALLSCSSNEKIEKQPVLDVDITNIQSVNEIEKLAFVNDEHIQEKVRKRLETETNKEIILALNYVLATYGNRDAIQFLIDDVDTMYEKSLKYLVRATGHVYLRKDIWQERWLDKTSEEKLKQETEKMRIPFEDLFERISIYDDSCKVYSSFNPPVYSNEYTNALASYGEAALDPIVRYLDGYESRILKWHEQNDEHMFNRISEYKKFTDAIYLIGTETHPYGTFINKKAREALLSLVSRGYTGHIMFLLSREHWLTDVPILFASLKKEDKYFDDIVRALKYYDLENISVHNEIPDDFSNDKVNFSFSDFQTYFDNFVETLKKLSNDRIQIEAGLDYKNVFKNYDLSKSKTSGSHKGTIKEQIESFLRDGSTEFCNYRFEYYFEDGVIHLISMKTARKRWLDWWKDNKHNVLKKIQAQQQSENSNSD